MGILASEKFLRFFDSYGKVLIFMQNIHPCCLLLKEYDIQELGILGGSQIITSISEEFLFT